ncbi:hypothetical protein [Propylenella binzhouense]|uniref:Uncharacterized protein n=1 Tax=Propylenella binzhouense TaxID=2555902 RepID=A0A964T3K1_9HYPH|nr:hypothetical protein [Propylenella binzhouense]MYZ47803.1 hypothetical protein [Propylenella binzhouense]
MNSNHRAFFESDEGQPFAEVLGQPYHRYGYALMSVIGQPAIAAAAWELDPLLQALPQSRRGFVKQACGGFIGDLVQQFGGRRAVTRSGRPRSARVPASREISNGAVWELTPQALRTLAQPLR